MAQVQLIKLEIEPKHEVVTDDALVDPAIVKAEIKSEDLGIIDLTVAVEDDDVQIVGTVYPPIAI